MSIVCKFGGTSLASAESVRRVGEIIKADDRRRFVVASAPGKKNKTDRKVTDLLIGCYANSDNEDAFNECFEGVKAAFRGVAALVPSFPIEDELYGLYNEIRYSFTSEDYVVSRGEYLSAKLLAAYLGYEFLDATRFIRFMDGELDLAATMEQAKRINAGGRYVIPGFYGVDEKGYVKTFSRGGSDITGSVVARVFGCELYENWTDVDGIYVADPRVISRAKKVEQVSYRELREMSYMGASVLHSETLLPLLDAPIPIHLKNTFEPEKAGTQIVKKRTRVEDEEVIACITGKNDHTCIQISKMMLDKQLGFVKKVTSVFEEYRINIAHTHSGLDNLCFFVERSEYKTIDFDGFLAVLKERVDADKIKGYEDLALLAVIGHNLSEKVGILATVFNALSKHDIGVRTVYQSPSECNIIIGIDDKELMKAIQIVYAELVG
ncbi:MAG: aspartate kinase [Clostridia bacterium]|nr:aspartate kinase [Clostridia bacterium]